MQIKVLVNLRSVVPGRDAGLIRAHARISMNQAAWVSEYVTTWQEVTGVLHVSDPHEGGRRGNLQGPPFCGRHIVILLARQSNDITTPQRWTML